MKKIDNLKGREEAIKSHEMLRKLDYAMHMTIQHVANKKGEVGSKERNNFIADMTPWFAAQSKYGKRVLAPFTTILINPTGEGGKFKRKKGEHWKPLAQMNYLDIKAITLNAFNETHFQYSRAGFENALGEFEIWDALDKGLGKTTRVGKEARILLLEGFIKGIKTQVEFKTSAGEVLSYKANPFLYDWTKGKRAFEQIIVNENNKLRQINSKIVKTNNNMTLTDQVMVAAAEDAIANSKPNLKFKKKKVMKDGLLKELKQRQFYEKPSLKKQRLRKESIKRINKLRRQQERLNNSN